MPKLVGFFIQSDSEPEELYKLLERKAGATSGDEARMNGEDVSPKVKGMSKFLVTNMFLI